MGREARGPRHGRPGEPQTTTGFLKNNSAYILSAVGVVVIVVLMIVFIRACAPQGKVEDKQQDNGVHVTPYNWDNLDRTGGRYSYVVDGKVKSKVGIDVSESQQWIDWNAVAGDGIDFAMIRLGYRGATEGELYLDEYFTYNLESAKEAKVDCGVYFFSQARTVDEAIEEADYVIKQLNGVKLEYPIAFDSEVLVVGERPPRTADLSDDEMTDIAEAFCKRVEQAGYQSMGYGNRYDVSRYDYERVNEINLWWAEYDEPYPSVQVDLFMWQYANDGEVAGIDTAVDMNLDLSRALD